MTLDLKYNNKIISFDVVYRKRKTIEIRIEPPDKVIVISPIGITKERIKHIVKKKGDWILTKLSEVADKKIAAISKDCNGEQRLLYLGEEYRLKVIENKEVKENSVYLNDDFIILEMSPNSPYTVEEALKACYKEWAMEIIKGRVKFYEDKFTVIPKSIKIKDQKTRWGSCTYKNELLFNFRCVMLSPILLDYIVVHEMCHMIEKNHAKGFWDLVESILPNYKELKLGLKNIRIE